jgi:hypothetical protein
MKNFHITRSTLFLLVILLSTCKKKDPAPTEPEQSPIPLLTTASVTSVTDSSGIAGGNVSSEGTAAIESIGICVDTIPSPTILKRLSIKGTALGSFTIQLNKLKPNYKYYVRAYATNSNGIAYGNEVTFTTPTIWSKLDSSALDNYIVNCLEADGESLYAGTDHGVFFSTDTGKTWVAAGLSTENVINLAVKEGIIFAGGHQFIERSTNNGSSWTSILQNFPATFLSVGDLVVSGSSLLVSTHKTVYSSIDNGDTWTSLGTGLPVNLFYSDLAIKGSDIFVGSSLIGGNSSSVYHLQEDATWTEVGSAFPLQSTKILDMAASGNRVFFTTPNAQGLFYSTNKGLSWQKETTLPDNITYLYGKEQNLFCCTSDGKYYTSTTSGNSWYQISNKGINGVIPFAVLLTDRYLYSATFDKGVFKRKRWMN